MQTRHRPYSVPSSSSLPEVIFPGRSSALFVIPALCLSFRSAAEESASPRGNNPRCKPGTAPTPCPRLPCRPKTHSPAGPALCLSFQRFVCHSAAQRRNLLLLGATIPDANPAPPLLRALAFLVVRRPIPRQVQRFVCHSSALFVIPALCLSFRSAAEESASPRGNNPRCKPGTAPTPCPRRPRCRK